MKLSSLKKLVLVLALASLVPGYGLISPLWAFASSDHLIVPGERIGPIRVGMDMDEVAATLGRPNITANATRLSGVEVSGPTWTYSSLNMGIQFSVGAAPSVIAITTCVIGRKTRTYGEMTMEGNYPIETVYRTANGIALGSSSFEVKRAYSSYDYEDRAGIDMMYRQLGISFMVGRDHRVWSLSVFQPNSRQF